MGTRQTAKWTKSDACRGAKYDMKELVVEIWKYFAAGKSPELRMETKAVSRGAGLAHL
jgi:hypothetical protein